MVFHHDPIAYMHAELAAREVPTTVGQPCDCGRCTECRAYTAFMRGEISIEEIDMSTIEELEFMVSRIEERRAARERIVAQIREMTADCPRATEDVVDVPF